MDVVLSFPPFWKMGEKLLFDSFSLSLNKFSSGNIKSCFVSQLQFGVHINMKKPKLEVDATIEISNNQKASHRSKLYFLQARDACYFS